MCALFVIKKKITSYISRQNKTVQIVLSRLSKAVIYGAILVTVLAINAFSHKLLRWWIYSGISWAVGIVFWIVDKIKEKENGEKI